MVEIIRNVILVIYVLICIVLIITTMQTRDSSGASQTITGGATNNFYEQNKGRTREGRIKRLTIISGILFVIIAIVLSILFVV